jgi:hypothetical protein
MSWLKLIVQNHFRGQQLMLTNFILVTCKEKFTRNRPTVILRGINRERGQDFNTFDQTNIDLDIR